MHKRIYVKVNGIVQGVGFRPFVFNLADKYGLKGWVKNTSEGVEIEIEGSDENLDKFLEILHKEPPPLAVIESIKIEHRAQNTEHRTQNVGAGLAPALTTQSTEHRTQNVGAGLAPALTTQSTEHRTQNVGAGLAPALTTQSTEHRTQNTERRAQSTEHRTQSTEHRAQSTEHRAQNKLANGEWQMANENSNNQQLTTNNYLQNTEHRAQSHQPSAISHQPSKPYKSFEIRKSYDKKDTFVPVSPDISICEDCLREMFSKNDRRYLYPFINCTNCGPRFTITKEIPYDRKNTTMEEFIMCSECQQEYDNPYNRRFHAQPNACHLCGPKLLLFHKNPKIKFKPQIKNENLVKKTINFLKQGKVIGVKGLGGYHLVCDACNDNAVTLLRKRKRRTDKPFAIMALDVETVKKFCCVSVEEEKILSGIRRPIVLLRRNHEPHISKYIAPGNNTLGVMLPYTPLHYLLLSENNFLALVMTSGNLSEEPIVYDDETVHLELSTLTDYILCHNRKINIRCDDSVLKVENAKEYMIRRARGYAPHPIYLSFISPGILACGGDLKNTFCISKDKTFFISQHIGDLEDSRAFDYYEETIEYFKKFFRITPEIIACDLHPNYFSTKYALAQKLQSVGIQHHHAHIASCMVDNGYFDKCIGVALDGTGYGTDGNIWGFEILICDFSNFSRFAQLSYIPLPGGDSAIKNPYRMALSYLYQYQSFGEDILNFDTVGAGHCACPTADFAPAKLKFFKRIPKQEIEIIMQMLKNPFDSPLCSSAGRLFDAVSSLLGIRDRITYEGQAAIELECMAWKFGDESKSIGSYDFEIEEQKGKKKEKREKGKAAKHFNHELRELREFEEMEKWKGKETERQRNIDMADLVVNPSKIFKGIIEDINNKTAIEMIAYKFHETIVNIITQICLCIREKNNLNVVALSGGVFQNSLLLRKTAAVLKDLGFEVLTHNRIPPNDAGISIGQNVIALQQIIHDTTH